MLLLLREALALREAAREAFARRLFSPRRAPPIPNMLVKLFSSPPLAPDAPALLAAAGVAGGAGGAAVLGGAAGGADILTVCQYFIVGGQGEALNA